MSPFPTGTEVDGDIPYAGQWFDRGGVLFNAMHPDFGATGDGTTDETAAIQALIDAVPANSSILIPPGTYNIVSTITIDKALTLYLNGALLQSAAADPIVDVTASNVTIVGNGPNAEIKSTLADPGANLIRVTTGLSNVTISGFTLTGITPTASDANAEKGNGIWFRSSVNFASGHKVFNMHMTGVHQGVAMWATKDADIHGNTISATLAGIRLHWVQRSKVYGNDIGGSNMGVFILGNPVGAAESQTSVYNSIIGNTIHDLVGAFEGIPCFGNYNSIIGNTINTAASWGIAIYGRYLGGGSYNTISGNTIFDMVEEGIVIEGELPAFPANGGAVGNVVTGNIIRNVSTGPSTVPAINLTGGATKTVVQGNFIQNANPDANGGDGIAVNGSTNTDTVIANNFIDTVRRGISVNGDRATITGNIIQNTNSSGEGIRISASADHLVVGNHLSSGDAARNAIALTATADRVLIAGNFIRDYSRGISVPSAALDNLAVGNLMDNNTSGGTDNKNPAQLLNVGNWDGALRDRILPELNVRTYGATINIPAGTAHIFTINATDTNAFTINAPTDPVTGQTITLDIKNSSGGALGVVTFNAAFLLAGAFTNPADTKRRTITFYFDGTSWIETNRAAADI